jgi:catechol 2,3-dioxygenase-like lactoylglutathione lyase family enzyme
VDYRLEMLVVPVSDVDRAKAFYERAGFNVDVDHQPNESFRVVQLTPPGSPCSITIGIGLGAEVPPGSAQGLHLVVNDIEAARSEFAGRGIDVSDIFHFGPEGQEPGPDPQRGDYASFVSFNDPDGNGWLLQEVHHR